MHEWRETIDWPAIEKWEGNFLIRDEVAVKNRAEDCWVIIHGIVRDLTKLVKDFKGEHCLLPLLAMAGKDISHWFDRKGETYVHPISKEELPYLPHGELPHICDNYKASPLWFRTPRVPWWKDKRYFIGRITKRERPIRIMNMLTGFAAKFTVCEEDTVGGRIAEKYRPYNWDLDSYLWTFNKKELDMDKTLTENGIEDILPRIRALGLPDCLYTPCICLYYKDDFK